MAHTCQLFFFVKMVPKSGKAPAFRTTKMHPETTIIWALGRQEAVAASKTAVIKRMEVKLSENLDIGGALKDVVDFEVFYINDPTYDKARAMALLHDASFTWAQGALAITLHQIDVSLSNKVEPHPFCVPTP